LAGSQGDHVAAQADVQIDRPVDRHEQGDDQEQEQPHRRHVAYPPSGQVFAGEEARSQQQRHECARNAAVPLDDPGEEIRQPAGQRPHQTFHRLSALVAVRALQRRLAVAAVCGCGSGGSAGHSGRSVEAPRRGGASARRGPRAPALDCAVRPPCAPACRSAPCLPKVRNPMTFRSRLGNETRATIRLALPLVAGQLCTVGMNVVETLLAGHRGGLTLAAVGVATPVWSIALLVSMGLMLAVPPSVAQLAGAGRRDAIAVVFRQALWLAVVTGVLLLAGLRFGGELLRRAGVDAAIIPEAEAFLDLLAFGAPAQSLFLAARGLSEGLGLTRPTMWFGLLGVLVLAPLGWALMHGRAGLPALGIRGLGLAYAIVLWTQALAMLAFLARHRNYRGLGLFAC